MLPTAEGGYANLLSSARQNRAPEATNEIPRPRNGTCSRTGMADTTAMPELQKPRKPRREKGSPKRESKGSPTPADGHIGAREDQVSNTQAPAGDAFKDEPKQG